MKIKLITLLLLPLMVVSVASAQTAGPRFAGDKISYDSRTIDVNFPDDTHVKPGATIVKKWKIHNAGSVEWFGRKLRLTGADHGFKQTKAYSFNCKPDKDVVMTVEVVAPMTPGHYRIYFKQWAADKAGIWDEAFPGSYRQGVYLDINVDEK